VCGCVWDGPKGSGEEDFLVVSRALAWYNLFLSFNLGDLEASRQWHRQSRARLSAPPLAVCLRVPHPRRMGSVVHPILPSR
jgi:hypothetical protein